MPLPRAAPGLMALALLSTGCLANVWDDAPNTPAPLCPIPCERAVDTSDRRAFEPSAALDPEDPDNAVIVSTIFRDDEALGHPMDFLLHTTGDGGQTWNTRRFWDLLPADSPVKRYTMLVDPMVAWLPDGSVIVLGMGATGSNPPEPGPPLITFTAFDVWLARSPDGGETWPEGQVVVQSQGIISIGASQGHYADQPHVAVGPNGTVVLGWVHVVVDPVAPTTYRIHSMVSRDHARTWGQPSLVDDRQAHNPRPALLADGTILMAFRDWTAPAQDVVGVARSEDGGTSWTLVQEIATTSRPTLAAAGGTVHLSVAQPGADTPQEVVLLASTDKGETWERTVIDAPTGDDDIVVNAVAARDGRVYVTWNRPIGNEQSEFWVYRIGPDRLSSKERLDDTPLGPNSPTGALGWGSLGDYFGLSVTEDGALAAWVSGAGSGQDVRAAFLGR